mmetsp:Transcript_33478/g.93977  ORF Transcript_33478/g.93977 Transcript_33478/m.93977 type:complete len:113 (-) Transcript_33478:2226-2564(-)
MSALLHLRNKKGIQGIYGRLGDLGTIDEKYDVAISTACPGLNNVVVESAKIAEACISFLRKNNLGVATFIVLDKQNYSYNQIATPNNVPRLLDLITPSVCTRLAPSLLPVSN